MATLSTLAGLANLNKTLKTVILLGAFNLLAKSGVSASHTGDTTETPLATIPLPANSLGPNGVMKITAFFSCTNSANNKTFAFRLGASGILGSNIMTGVMTTEGSFQAVSTTICANATNSQNTQGWFDRGTDHLQTGAGVVASAVDLTQAQNVVITGKLANTGETFTLLGYIIEYNN